MIRKIVVEELARVEGHGGITVELDADRVRNVRFDVFEGPRVLEALLQGRHYSDVAPTVSRICAICSAAHYVTSLKATEAAFGVRVSPQTELLRELLFRGESIESHALHVFLLAAPDYLGYPSATAMAADYPEVVKLGLQLKQLGNLIQDAVGGRAIHPVNPVLGGFGTLPSISRFIELRDRLLAAIDAIPTIADFIAALPRFEGCRVDTNFAALTTNEASGYSLPADIVLQHGDARSQFGPANYRAFTNEKSVAHSFARHSSFEQQPFMVGALARLTLNRHRIQGRAADFMSRIDLSVPSCDPLDNNKAQAVELVVDLEWCRQVLQDFIESGLAHDPPVRIEPRAATGTAVTEAPRGLLVHSYSYNEDFRIARADVITPTAMNAASLENHLRLAVDQSTDRSDAGLVRKLEMIARAYDPCISCSVHMVRLRDNAP